MEDEETDADTKRRQKAIPVTVLATRGQSALVAWREDGDRERRVYVPADQVSSGAVEAGALASGIPHGLPWNAVKICADGQRLEDALHARGIWTLEDLLADPSAGAGAVKTTLELSYGKLLEEARKLGRQEEGNA
jgi:hypothetical protein